MSAAAAPHPPVTSHDNSLRGARAWFAEKGLSRPRKGRLLAGVFASFARRYDVNPLSSSSFFHSSLLPSRLPKAVAPDPLTNFGDLLHKAFDEKQARDKKQQEKQIEEEKRIELEKQKEDRAVAREKRRMERHELDRARSEAYRRILTHGQKGEWEATGERRTDTQHTDKEGGTSATDSNKEVNKEDENNPGPSMAVSVESSTVSEPLRDACVATSVADPIPVVASSSSLSASSPPPSDSSLSAPSFPDLTAFGVHPHAGTEATAGGHETTDHDKGEGQETTNTKGGGKQR